MQPTKVVIWKNIGETPLEALERFRAEEVTKGRVELKGVPMTYAGRLDPMAEGELLILVGDECKNKEKYLGLDKEYEVEIVFGIETDTYDALGLAAGGKEEGLKGWGVEEITQKITAFPKTYEQTYPPYSSKTYKGTQLHELTRAGELPDPGDMPSRNVTLYSTSLLEKGELSSDALKKRILNKIVLVKGDFRQREIEEAWKHFFLNNENEKFPFIRLYIFCSSGTYMRSLAHKLGKEMDIGAFALSIKRLKIVIP
ncbi:MAG: hypothetical protein V4481_01255 [Patescibacteria group bacterium]